MRRSMSVNNAPATTVHSTSTAINAKSPKVDLDRALTVGSRQQSDHSRRRLVPRADNLQLFLAVQAVGVGDQAPSFGHPPLEEVLVVAVAAPRIRRQRHRLQRAERRQARRQQMEPIAVQRDHFQSGHLFEQFRADHAQTIPVQVEFDQVGQFVKFGAGQSLQAVVAQIEHRQSRQPTERQLGYGVQVGVVELQSSQLVPAQKRVLGQFEQADAVEQDVGRLHRYRPRHHRPRAADAVHRAGPTVVFALTPRWADALAVADFELAAQAAVGADGLVGTEEPLGRHVHQSFGPGPVEQSAVGQQPLGPLLEHPARRAAASQRIPSQVDFGPADERPVADAQVGPTQRVEAVVTEVDHGQGAVAASQQTAGDQLDRVGAQIEYLQRQRQTVRVERFQRVVGKVGVAQFRRPAPRPSDEVSHFAQVVVGSVQAFQFGRQQTQVQSGQSIRRDVDQPEGGQVDQHPLQAGQPITLQVEFAQTDRIVEAGCAELVDGIVRQVEHLQAAERTERAPPPKGRRTVQRTRTQVDNAIVGQIDLGQVGQHAQSGRHFEQAVVVQSHVGQFGHVDERVLVQMTNTVAGQVELAQSGHVLEQTGAGQFERRSEQVAAQVEPAQRDHFQFSRQVDLFQSVVVQIQLLQVAASGGQVGYHLSSSSSSSSSADAVDDVEAGQMVPAQVQNAQRVERRVDQVERFDSIGAQVELLQIGQSVQADRTGQQTVGRQVEMNHTGRQRVDDGQLVAAQVQLLQMMQIFENTGADRLQSIVLQVQNPQTAQAPHLAGADVENFIVSQIENHQLLLFRATLVRRPLVRGEQLGEVGDLVVGQVEHFELAEPAQRQTSNLHQTAFDQCQLFHRFGADECVLVHFGHRTQTFQMQRFQLCQAFGEQLAGVATVDDAQMTQTIERGEHGSGKTTPARRLCALQKQARHAMRRKCGKYRRAGYFRPMADHLHLLRTGLLQAMAPNRAIQIIKPTTISPTTPIRSVFRLTIGTLSLACRDSQVFNNN
ncbi:hypothetical protein T12_8009 [Trichinella patagoniensis]|uniref:Uncharacterized protein n=1 Tax=Trichinella patagoniensis TaxID=990121 RepID=A0A0V0ZTD9_9BILA|nr:hypothetical protein T12_8009 [Trichinella patagoniensis]